MANTRAIGLLALGALIALGLPTQGQAAARLSAAGNAFITNVDGTPIHARDVVVPAGLHGLAVDFRDHTRSAWCIFYCRVADNGQYRVRTEIQRSGYVRLWLLGRDGVPQVLWAASRPGGKLTPARALDVHLQSLDYFDIVVDARMLPGHN